MASVTSAVTRTRCQLSSRSSWLSVSSKPAMVISASSDQAEAARSSCARVGIPDAILPVVGVGEWDVYVVNEVRDWIASL